MKLSVTQRKSEKPSDVKNLRRQGQIPAILYSKGEKGEPLVVDGAVFRKVLNTTPVGTLSSKIFTLQMENKSVQALVKDIQYKVTSYEVIHIDFEELHPQMPVTLNVPVVCVNGVDCVGIKLGGVLRQLMRHVRVSCLPKHIPPQFEVNIKDLMIGQGVRLGELSLPVELRVMGNPQEMVVVIARK